MLVIFRWANGSSWWSPLRRWLMCWRWYVPTFVFKYFCAAILVWILFVWKFQRQLYFITDPALGGSRNKSCSVSCPDHNCMGSYTRSSKVVCVTFKFGYTRLINFYLCCCSGTVSTGLGNVLTQCVLAGFSNHIRNGYTSLAQFQSVTQVSRSNHIIVHIWVLEATVSLANKDVGSFTEKTLNPIWIGMLWKQWKLAKYLEICCNLPNSPKFLFFFTVR